MNVKFKFFKCKQIATKKKGNVSIVNGSKKFEWVCHLGHYWTSTYESVDNGAWCPDCYFNDKNIDPKNYRLNRIKKYCFLYKTINLSNNKIYIGVHFTDRINDGYLGSGLFLKKAIKKYGLKNFKREILEFFNDAASAFSREKQIVNRNFINLKNNYNAAEGGGGGYVPKNKECYSNVSRVMKGMVSCIDSQGNFIKVTKKEFDEDINLIGQTKGILIMKDKQGKINKTHKDDPRIKNGELIGLTKNIAVMKDKFGKVFCVSKDDKRIKTGELVGVTKGSVQLESANLKRSNKLKGIKKEHPLAMCNYCMAQTNIANIKRWHNDNCKFKNEKNPQESFLLWNKLPIHTRNKIMKRFKKTGIFDIKKYLKQV